jgi:hypothetical protein
VTRYFAWSAKSPFQCDDRVLDRRLQVGGAGIDFDPLADRLCRSPLPAVGLLKIKMTRPFDAIAFREHARGANGCTVPIGTSRKNGSVVFHRRRAVRARKRAASFCRRQRFGGGDVEDIADRRRRFRVGSISALSSPLPSSSSSSSTRDGSAFSPHPG